MSTFADGGSGQIVLGISGPKVINHSSFAYRKRGKGNIVRMGSVAPVMVTLTASFTCLVNGSYLAAREFTFQTPDKRLLIYNADPVIGLTADPGGSFAIPLTKIDREQTLTSLTGYPTPIS